MLFTQTSGLKGRFLVAFLGISALTVIGATVAMVAIGKLNAVFSHVTRDRVPSMLTALELSREAERLAAIAPRLISDEGIVEQLQTDRLIRVQIGKLDRLFSEVKKNSSDTAAVAAIESAVQEVRKTLGQIQEFREIWGDNSSLEGGINEDRTSAPFALGVLVPPSRGELLVKGQQMIQQNIAAAGQLANAVDHLISDEKAAIARGELAAAATQRSSSIWLMSTLALSIVGSILVTWLYVGRNIVSRLTALSSSMLAMAQGNQNVPLPTDTGTDEVGQMARALRIFREKLDENTRLSRLKSFLAPQVAEIVVSSGDDNILKSHRRDVAVLFCDLRGFSAFAETAEPEEVMSFLTDYREALVALTEEHGGTLERFTGDGLIVLFNDPLPMAEPCLAAARLAVAMRQAVNTTMPQALRLHRHLGFGIGISYGYATLGQIGTARRLEYTAIGSVVNLAARLCEKAKDNQILVDWKIQQAIAGHMAMDDLGEFTPKGFSRAVRIFNIEQSKTQQVA